MTLLYLHNRTYLHLTQSSDIEYLRNPSNYPDIFVFLGSWICIWFVIHIAPFMYMRLGLESIHCGSYSSEFIQADHPYVEESIRELSQTHTFGYFKHGGRFVQLHHVQLSGNHLFCEENHKTIAVSKKINREKRLCRSRWIDHIYFKDTSGNTTRLKEYIAAKYNVVFRRRYANGMERIL